MANRSDKRTNSDYLDSLTEEEFAAVLDAVHTDAANAASWASIAVSVGVSRITLFEWRVARRKKIPIGDRIAEVLAAVDAGHKAGQAEDLAKLRQLSQEGSLHAIEMRLRRRDSHEDPLPPEEMQQAWVFGNVRPHEPFVPKGE